MSPDEANKIIAEYMGYTEISKPDKENAQVFTHISSGNLTYKCDYHTHLDALVPVWEKLGFTSINLFLAGNYKVEIDVYGRVSEMEARGKTIQEAAAIATAKAIMELNEKA